MDDAKRELVRAWLIKARHDLDAVRQISTPPEGHLDTAIYHCQQAAEKVLKGFLAFHDHRLARTHDLEQLIALAAEYNQEFARWTDAATTLTPYATAYRYPGESISLEPSREEFDEALQLAESLVSFTLSVLPEDLWPT